MKIEKIVLSEEKNTCLTGYLLDCGGELVNTNIRPAVLIMPGGAYMSCSDREAEPIAMAFLNEGYHAFILKYSVGENAAWPTPLEDAETAMEIIRSRCKQWKVDENRVVAVGFSAGGHLAAALGVFGKNRPNAMILGYPCILEEISSILATKVPGIDEAVDEKTVPTFVFATRDDNLVPIKNTIRFIEKLDANQIPFECHIYGTGLHGLSLAKSHTSGGISQMVNPKVEKWFGECIEWLRQTWGDFESNGEMSFHIAADSEQEFYSVDNSIRILLDNVRCKEIVYRYLPFLEEAELPAEALAISLQMMLDYQKDAITADNKNKMNQELLKIKIEG